MLYPRCPEQGMSIFPWSGKVYTHNGVNGDMAWPPVCVKQWKSVLKLNSRLESMDNSRLNRKVYDWMCNNSSIRCKNWKFRICKQLETYNIQENGNNSLPELQNAMFNAYKNSWINAINSDRGASTSGMNAVAQW